MEKTTTYYVDDEWKQEQAEYIRSRLFEYNKTHAPANHLWEPFSFIVKDAEEAVCGGIVGARRWNYIKVDYFWLDESMRGLGFGKRLLSQVEDFARQRQCDFIELETFSFQAPDFYMRNGFEIVGVIDNAPHGHKHYYLIKKLA